MTSDEVATLSSRAKAFGLEWTESIHARLSAYQFLLHDRGGRTNLVSRGDLGQLVEVHFVDCMRPLPYLPTGHGSRVLDLGSGAGLPGVVLKAFRPDLALYLVEAARRKSLFLQQVMKELRFEGARVLNVRAEDLADDGDLSESMDVVVARAVADLGQVAEWSRPLLLSGGSLLTFKPLDPWKEIDAARRRGRLRGFSPPEVLSEPHSPSPRGSLVKLVKEGDA